MSIFDLTEDLAHPGKCAFKAMNIQLWFLSMDISTDGKQVLEYRVSKLVTLIKLVTLVTLVKLNKVSLKF